MCIHSLPTLDQHHRGEHKHCLEKISFCAHMYVSVGLQVPKSLDPGNWGFFGWLGFGSVFVIKSSALDILTKLLRAIANFFVYQFQ